ncbi:MAG: hypothetical protein M1834_000931 [Cirrosporium novae-zelandiae]|nr:MAG: hypothetical protein M1834_000931 [Cirrosporium novae-zelandiae]
MQQSADRIKKSPKQKQNDAWRKRTRTILNKLYELSVNCNADVYLLLCRNGKYYVHRSNRKEGWPPTQESLDACHQFREECTDFDVKIVPEGQASHRKMDSKSSFAHKPPKLQRFAD